MRRAGSGGLQGLLEPLEPPSGYRIGSSGEYKSEHRAEARMAVIVTLTILVIFIILYTMFRSF
jgi:cobalt-zinc-cadmium resistance protein CzcA